MYTTPIVVDLDDGRKGAAPPIGGDSMGNPGPKRTDPTGNQSLAIRGKARGTQPDIAPYGTGYGPAAMRRKED